MTRNDLFSAEHPIWDPIECLPQADREALQLERLRGLVERVSEVPFYKRAFAEADITPASSHWTTCDGSRLQRRQTYATHIRWGS